MYYPVSTYRLQFHKAFTFDDFEKIIPYLRQLGITTIYASPVFHAMPGSIHGYDVLDPNSMNPEIGTREQLMTLHQILKQHGMGWLQDIVPNHMAFDTKNQWLLDVLEKGRRSPYAAFFDIMWDDQVHNSRLMVPFLGSSLEEAIQKNEIRIAWNEGRLQLVYHQHSYPVQPATYSTVLQLKKRPAASIRDVIKNIAELQAIEDPGNYSRRWSDIWLALQANDAVQKSLQTAIETINTSGEMLLRIANEQFYQLCHWQETNEQINFRRFFTINGLICLNMQHEEVFVQSHRMISELLEQEVFNGLRIDHIDGLYDPQGYLSRLREAVGDESYIVVEKILQHSETLPFHWDIEGTTGYDFLSMVNNLFTNKKNEAAFTRFYRQLTKDRKTVQQHLHDKKSDILSGYMQGELENLYHLFHELKLADRKEYSAVHPDDLKNALAELLVQCPVYRYYGNQFPLDEREATAVRNLFDRMRRSGTANENAIAILEKSFLHKPHANDEEYNRRVARFYQRCMQFTGPIMAKGVEDTLMYTFNRLISHNEVGDAPESFGILATDFHQAMMDRQDTWPLSLSATATHDTKRGEDVRARLNVLSDIPDEWFRIVGEWNVLAEPLTENGKPDKNDEYFIYQSLVGSYPMPGQEDVQFESRMIAYLQKALREAKRHSNWTAPDETYEHAATQFVKNLLNENGEFRKSFESFHRKISDFGIVNSLSQLLLKFTCPGVPDIYQGCELWELSFVDPDNRRLVDYEQRRTWLNELSTREIDDDFLHLLWQERYNGKIKLWLTHQLLQWRREQNDFLQKAEYIPLTVEGAYKKNVLAFARKYKNTMCIIAVPLYLAEMTGFNDKDITDTDWKDTQILLPGNLSGAMTNLLTGKPMEKGIGIKDLFTKFPVALIKAQLEEHKRGAGILMHISSLPSPFGVGDLGHEARIFAGFLYRARQHYWQVLPINPTEGGQGFSPYSAISGKAGNPLFISPELLAREKLLNDSELKNYHLPHSAQADFETSEKIKHELAHLAYMKFDSGTFATLQKEFEEFSEREKDWLDDFALYAMLKTHHRGKPWYEWDDPFKLRSEQVLEAFGIANDKAIREIKWLQFIFFRQWFDLKEYCNNLDIRLIGDIPFYVSYDSADVWANREIFALDDKGNRTGMAGVPPDAFSSDGQLWGMPVYEWEVLESRNFDWWVSRVRKNLELFDIVRLDHFRAFDEYWEVPAGETTARNGTWKPCPGRKLLETLQNELGDLPFIAEDLGEITEGVYQLRDKFRLPGMKVLQFAFGGDMPHSTHIFHHHEQNFVVFTGTHDNNTTAGWYKTEAGNELKQRLQQYLGRSIQEQDIARELSRTAYSSVGKIVILPMQDVLGLDESARMNTPSSAHNNWRWRLLPGQLSAGAEHQLKEWAYLYDRQ